MKKSNCWRFFSLSGPFFDIDGNQHVNNAIYFNWILDVLGYDFLTKYEPTNILVKFDKEVEYGQEVESHFETITEEGQLKTRHEIRMSGQTIVKPH